MYIYCIVPLLYEFCHSAIIHASSLLNKIIDYVHSSDIFHNMHIKFTNIVNFVLWLSLFNMSGKIVKLCHTDNKSLYYFGLLLFHMK